MNVSLVLTVLGDDRPGLVESVAEVVARYGGNWLESRMSRLAGKFAGLARVDVPADNADAMITALQDLESRGLHVLIAKGAEDGTEGREQTLQLELVGADRPGMVREIARILASNGINVDDLTTEISNAPMSGEPMFKVTARLRAGSDVSLPKLQEALERLANELMVDIHLESASPVS